MTQGLPPAGPSPALCLRVLTRKPGFGSKLGLTEDPLMLCSLKHIL